VQLIQIFHWLLKTLVFSQDHMPAVTAGSQFLGSFVLVPVASLSASLPPAQPLQVRAGAGQA
jgi:hypothetical protein